MVEGHKDSYSVVHKLHLLVLSLQWTACRGFDPDNTDEGVDESPNKEGADLVQLSNLQEPGFSDEDSSDDE